MSAVKPFIVAALTLIVGVVLLHLSIGSYGILLIRGDLPIFPDSRGTFNWPNAVAEPMSNDYLFSVLVYALSLCIGAGAVAIGIKTLFPMKIHITVQQARGLLVTFAIAFVVALLMPLMMAAWRG